MQNVNLILSEIDNEKEKLFKLLVNITSIQAPTGHEQKRMHFIKEKVKEHGINDVSIDSIGNCIAHLPSKSINGKGKNILVVAHADTACNPGKKIVITEDEKYIYGHGICDNSAGITGLLTTIALFQKYHLEFPNNLIFGFTVGEEGLGGKKGMKQIIKEYGKKIDAVINVESHHIGRVTNQAIGQYRSLLTVNTKLGGHSFRDFGRPSANVILSQIISDFSHHKLPKTKGKTTFNVGEIKGEGNINTIPITASCLFEIRSEDNKNLQKVKAKFKSILGFYRKRFNDIEITENILAEVPAVIFPKNNKIYKLTIDSQKYLGITPKINAGNTDGDVSLAAGIQTVTIGTSEGWNTHSLQEYMEKKSLPLGIKQVFMVIYQIASNF